MLKARTPELHQAIIRRERPFKMKNALSGCLDSELRKTRWQWVFARTCTHKVSPWYRQKAVCKAMPLRAWLLYIGQFSTSLGPGCT